MNKVSDAEKREVAWRDRRAWDVGFFDFRLQQSRNPYPAGSVYARMWQDGYEDAKRAYGVSA